MADTFRVRNQRSLGRECCQCARGLDLCPLRTPKSSCSPRTSPSLRYRSRAPRTYAASVAWGDLALWWLEAAKLPKKQSG